MKQILWLVGQNLVQSILRPAMHAGGHSNSHGPSLLDPVKEYVSDTIRKYALVIGLSFLFTLYFVAGTLIMITAAAESFDAFGFFAPGAFFYSGLGITVISIAVLAGCLFSIRKGSQKKIEQKIIDETPVEPPVFNMSHIAEAVVTGIISGLVSRRMSRKPEAPIVIQPRTLRDRLREVI